MFDLFFWNPSMVVFLVLTLANPVSFVALTLILLLPTPFAIRLGVVIFSVLLVWYELTPPIPFSNQGWGDAIGMLVVGLNVIVILAILAFRSIRYYGFQCSYDDDSIVPLTIDSILAVLLGAMCGFFTITIGARMFANASLDMFSHLFLFSFALGAIWLIIQEFREHAEYGHFSASGFFMFGFSSMALIGLVVSIWHITSVTKSAKLLAGNKAYCITKVKNLMDLSFLTMKKFNHPNLVIQGNKNNTVLTWSFRQQNFLQTYGQLQCRTKLNFIGKLPIF